MRRREPREAVLPARREVRRVPLVTVARVVAVAAVVAVVAVTLAETVGRARRVEIVTIEIGRRARR